MRNVTVPDPSPGGDRLWRVAPWLILAIALFITGASVVLLARATHSRDDAWFSNRVQAANGRILDRVDVYRATLRGGAGLFGADTAVSAEAFRRFVVRLSLPDLYPGIQGVGWARRISRRPGGTADERYEVEYLEPVHYRNRTAPDTDPYTDGVRRAAMELARDRGGAALSRRLMLGSEGSAQGHPGFVVFLPVYRGGGLPATLRERREQLLGFVFAPLHAGEFFDGIVGADTAVSITVYDGPRPASGALLYASPRPAGHTPRHRKTDTLYIAGHEWTVVFESTPAFDASSWEASIPWVLVLGLMASGLLFLVARSLARALRAAESANRAKSAFLATMSHELRTPLNAIIGYADLLDLGVPEPIGADARRQVGRIQSGAQHLLGIIEAILQLARTEAAMDGVHLESVDIRKLVGSAVELTRPMARKKGLDVDCAFTDSLQTIRTDPQKVRQILINLIGNAVKFTDAGGIRVEATLESTDVVVRVSDTGVGITPEHHERIFSPFWQVEQGHTRRAGGAGLGLAVSRNLARLLGGEITVASRLGEGSTFTVRLPPRK